MPFFFSRLLKHFETLKVPVEKMSYLQNARKFLAKEKEQCGSLEEGLAVLEVREKGREDKP